MGVSACQFASSTGDGFSEDSSLVDFVLDFILSVLARIFQRQGYKNHMCLMLIQQSEADPDLELRGVCGLDLLALLAFFPSVISSFFTQDKGGGDRGRAPGPSPRPPLSSDIDYVTQRGKIPSGNLNDIKLAITLCNVNVMLHE